MKNIRIRYREGQRQIQIECYAVHNDWCKMTPNDQCVNGYIIPEVCTFSSCGYKRVSYQIRFLRIAHALGLPGTLFLLTTSNMLLVTDPGIHHSACVTHVPWWMPGSLTRGGGENVPGIPVACATRNFAYLLRGPWPHDFCYVWWYVWHAICDLKPQVLKNGCGNGIDGYRDNGDTYAMHFKYVSDEQLCVLCWCRW